MPEPVKPTPEETIARIAQLAKDQGDSFLVRVFTRRGGSPFPTNIAALEEATAEHIVQAEPWISRLAGGGQFMLQVFHKNDRINPIGGFLPINVAGDPANVDPYAASSRDWRGPALLVHPPPPAAPTFSPGGGHGTGLRNPDPTGGGTPPGGNSNAATHPGSAASDILAIQAQARAEANSQALAALDRERARDEIANLRATMEALRAKPAEPAPKGPSIAEIIGAAAPMVTAFLQQAAESRRASEAAQLAAQQRHAEMLQAMLAQQQALTTSLLTRPAIPPELQAILAQREDNAGSQVKMFSQMAEGMGAMVNMSVQALHAAAELQSPPDGDTPTLKFTREIIKGITSLAGAARAPVTFRETGGAGASPPAALPPGAPRTDAPDEKPPSAFDQTVAKILAQAPAPEVAGFFLDHWEDPSIVAELERHDSNPLQAFAPHVIGWIGNDAAKADYIKGVIEELQRQFEARGGKRVEADAPANGDQHQDVSSSADDADEQAIDAEGGTVPPAETPQA